MSAHSESNEEREAREEATRQLQTEAAARLFGQYLGVRVDPDDPQGTRERAAAAWRKSVGVFFAHLDRVADKLEESSSELDHDSADASAASPEESHADEAPALVTAEPPSNEE